MIELKPGLDAIERIVRGLLQPFGWQIITRVEEDPRINRSTKVFGFICHLKYGPDKRNLGVHFFLGMNMLLHLFASEDYLALRNLVQRQVEIVFRQTLDMLWKDQDVCNPGDWFKKKEQTCPSA